MLPPQSDTRAHAFWDGSGGRHDAAAVAIALEGDPIVGACVYTWPAPHNPESVIAEAAALIRAYGCHEVTSDRYSAEFARTAWERNGIRFAHSDLDRSALYLELLPKVLSGGVRIPNDARLLKALRGLERKRGSLRDRVDHRAGAHDDASNAFAGAVRLAAHASRHVIIAAPGGSVCESPFGRL